MTDHHEASPTALTVHGQVRGRLGDGVAPDEVAAWTATVWDLHRADIFSFAVALVRDRDAADDLVAEAFLRLVREVRDDRPPSDPRAWLFRVVANLSVSRGRRLRTAQRFVRHLVDRRTAPSADDALLHRELPPDLEAALMGLKPDSRAAVVMAAYGLSGRDIALSLGRTETSTRTLLHRARLDLRARLTTGGDR